MKELLFKPFERYSGFPLLLTGLLTTAVGILFSYLFNTRFDGALDVHLVSKTSLFTSISDAIVVILVVAILLYLATLLVNTKTRFIDILGTVLIARIPMYLLPLLHTGKWIDGLQTALATALKTGDLDGLSPLSIFMLIAFALFSMAFAVWSVALLYNGYKVASNAKGSKPILLFILALVLAEIITKVIIYQIN